MKLKEGELLQWLTVMEDYDGSDIQHIGIVTKKASRGYWVLWDDGSHKVLPRELIKHTRKL